MAVSTIKAGWSKFSARIRDYIDVVDSYYRPSDDLQVSTPTQCQHKTKHTNLCDRTIHKHVTSDKRNHHNFRNSHDHRAIITKSPTASSQHSSHQRSHPHSNHHLNCISLLDVQSSKLSRNQLPHGYCKRKTPQGQVYFVDVNGQKHWYDPCVPKELLAAQLDLDKLVGKLSPTWEIRHTHTGKTYYVNHTKKTTQFTDPRLVVHKDHLMNILRQTYGSIVTRNSSERPPQRQPLSTASQRTHINNPGHRDTNDSLLSQHNDANPMMMDNRFSSLQRVGRDQVAELSRHHVPWSLRSTNTETTVASNQGKLNASNSRMTSTTNQFNIYALTKSGPRSSNTANQSSQMRNSQISLHQIGQHASDREGHSNTLTGPLPGWWRAAITKPNASNTPMSTSNRHNSSTHQATAVSHNNTSSNSHNCSSQTGLCLNRIPEVNPVNEESYYDCAPVDGSKELSEKITTLRQELLKQQVLTHPCRIDLNRKRIFEESYRIISQLQPRDLRKRLLVKFRGEEGLDYGGVAREWFYMLSREILNPVHGLFQYTSGDIYNLQINPDSGIVYREHLSYLNFCGRIMGMAVFHGHFIEGHFTLPFYKMLLKKPISLKDIENVDPELHRSLCWILENDITNVIDTTFLVQHNAFGQLQEHELKPGGRNIAVTEENKHEYVSLYVNYRCRRGIEHQFEALQRGFYDLISPHLLDNFDEHELELLIGGLSKINVEDWRQHTKLKNCTAETSLVIWFWDIVRSYSEDKRAQLLQFVTGSPRVPIQGFKALQGVNSELRLFTIHLIKNACTDNLPKSHTCFNRIDLPPYESYEKLRDKLTQAIEETMGFAMQ